MTKYAYKAHPLAETFGIADDEKIEEMADSIRKIGQINPILLIDELVLDGRDRLRACKLAGVEPTVRQYDGPRDFVALQNVVNALNRDRKHFSKSQLAMAAFRQTSLAQEKAPELFEVPPDAEGNGKATLKAAAETLGVSERMVDLASTVSRSGAAALVKAVEEGKVSVVDAAAIADLPKGEQVTALKKVTSGKARSLKAAVTKTHRKRKGDEKVRAVDRKAAMTKFGELKRSLDRLGEQPTKVLNALDTVIGWIKSVE